MRTYLDIYHEYVAELRGGTRDFLFGQMRTCLQPLPHLVTHTKTDITAMNIISRKVSEMARGKKKSETPRNNNVTFVTVRLTDEDRSLLAERDEITASEAWDFIDRMAQDGYKLSFGMQDNGSVNVTATCRDTESPNHGYALSGWGDSVATALTSLRYKHVEICEGVWPKETESSAGVPKFG